MLRKTQLSESDICAKYITPALLEAGWAEENITREVSFTAGRIMVRGKTVARGSAKRADYILYLHGTAIAVIEAKDNARAIGAGLQQALDYAATLETPFVFSANGDGFVFHDKTLLATPNGALETTLNNDQFPEPARLWSAYLAWKGLAKSAEALLTQPYYDDGSGKSPRYYQRNAINATVEAIAKGQNRVLLVMATGTGKTLTAFQIIWRLWKSKHAKRILFLADRNVLINQTMVNDFRPFGGAMAKLSKNAATISRSDGAQTPLPLAMNRQRRVDSSYEIYLGLYQSLTGPEEQQKIFRDFSPTFFDLIVIDECHRGSAQEDSAWREILTYFTSAAHIGLTATPKETEYASNTHYFGEPVYSYSLKQGIQDGFLAPYKVIKVHLDIDIEGYRPVQGQLDQQGQLIDDRLFNQKDFDRSLIIDERTARVAKWVSDYLKASGDRMQKTIVFCVDTGHAARMRQALANENADLMLKSIKYAMRITGDDPDGIAQLDSFIDPRSAYPVLVTTSRLLSTGVDAQTCRLIVLDRAVGSMTEFKQIVGRGTRIHADSGKFYFTVVDFRKATNHFADPDFDGEPVQIYEPGEADPPLPPDDELPLPTPDAPPAIPTDTDTDAPATPLSFPPPPGEPRSRFYINGQRVTVLKERIEYLDANGKLVTESLRDYSRKTILSKYASLDVFLQDWHAQPRKEALLQALSEQGLILEPLREELANQLGSQLDAFDLICHVAFDAPPLTRQQRTAQARHHSVYTQYGDQARAVLDALLDKYQSGELHSITDLKLLEIPPISQLGMPVQIVKLFGGKNDFELTVLALQDALYTHAA